MFIEPTLVRMLSSHLAGRTSGRVFQIASGKPHSGHNVWRKLKLILNSLGLQPGGLKAIRHDRVSMLQANGMPGDLLPEQVQHSNLTHFDDAFRQRMARAQGLFLEGGWSPWSEGSGFSEYRTCHVTCSRMKGLTSVGEWLSLVEHLVRDQGVGGSNPLSPTNLSLALSVCLDSYCHLSFFGTFRYIRYN